jgi:hypothetical protein
MKPEVRYIINGASVIPVVEVGDDHLVPAHDMIERKDIPVFNSREDARYHCLLRDLENGKSIENYKSSRYYKYYIKRLKEENPEYIL